MALRSAVHPMQWTGQIIMCCRKTLNRMGILGVWWRWRHWL